MNQPAEQSMFEIAHPATMTKTNTLGAKVDNGTDTSEDHFEVFQSIQTLQRIFVQLVLNRQQVTTSEKNRFINTATWAINIMERSPEKSGHNRREIQTMLADVRDATYESLSQKQALTT